MYIVNVLTESVADKCDKNVSRICAETAGTAVPAAFQLTAFTIF